MVGYGGLGVGGWLVGSVDDLLWVGVYLSKFEWLSGSGGRVACDG